MTVLLMTMLQMPCASTAATIVRVDARHLRQQHQQQQQHSSGSSNESDSDYSDDANSSSSSNSIEDIIEIVMKDNGERAHAIQRTRKAKRHSSSDMYLSHHQHESDTELEWANPCGGDYNESIGEDIKRPIYYLKKLRNTARNEFRAINYTMDAIDISDMVSWSYHSDGYAFLPNISMDSNIAYKRWYRNIQTYVATFAYLGRKQLKWDQTWHMTPKEATHELNQLLLSARNVLCEIETAINGSYAQPSSQHKLTATSRKTMNERLQALKSRKAEADNPGKIMEPAMVDLKFAKYKYYRYLRRMWRIIRMKTKRNGQRQLSLGLSSERASDASASFAAIENLINADINERRLGLSYSLASDSSSASVNFQQSTENKSKGRRRTRQRKNKHKSAELPQL